MSDAHFRGSILVTDRKTLCGQPSCHHFACGWTLAAEAAEKIAEERDRYRAALEDIAHRPVVERNPDGDDQAAYTMQLIACEALEGPADA